MTAGKQQPAVSTERMRVWTSPHAGPGVAEAPTQSIHGAAAVCNRFRANRRASARKKILRAAQRLSLWTVRGGWWLRCERRPECGGSPAAEACRSVGQHCGGPASVGNHTPLPRPACIPVTAVPSYRRDRASQPCQQ